VTNRTSTVEALYVDPESWAEIVKRAFASNGELFEAESHFRRKTGETIVVRFFVRKIAIELGESGVLKDFMEDITGRKMP
jgi:hypothetical protein